MLSDSQSALVAVRARDFERAVAFYKEVLGLEMTFHRQNRWAEFRAAGLTIGIEAAEDGAMVGGGSAAICFEVDSIEEVVDSLRTRGVSFLGAVVQRDNCKEAHFTDSEGTPLLLYESSSSFDPSPTETRRRRRASRVTKKTTKKTMKAKARPKPKGKIKAKTGAAGSRKKAAVGRSKRASKSAKRKSAARKAGGARKR